jgi:hypothetical protein
MPDIDDLEGSIIDNKDRIKEIEDDINELDNKVTYLESKKIRFEHYKVFLYPNSILKYIKNIIDCQERNKCNNRFYPSDQEKVQNYFDPINPGRIDLKKILYDNTIELRDLKKISKIISNQGWSALNHLETLKYNTYLNKPTILYYGIMQLSVFYSNLHFNFTSQNRTLSCLSKQFRSHGISTSFINSIPFNIKIDSLLLDIEIKLKKAGIVSRFILTYKDYFIDYFINEEKLTLLNLIKNYFWLKPGRIKEEFKKDIGSETPQPNFNSKILSIQHF